MDQKTTVGEVGPNYIPTSSSNSFQGNQTPQHINVQQQFQMLNPQQQPQIMSNNSGNLQYQQNMSQNQNQNFQYPQDNYMTSVNNQQFQQQNNQFQQSFSLPTLQNSFQNYQPVQMNPYTNQFNQSQILQPQQQQQQQQPQQQKQPQQLQQQKQQPTQQPYVSIQPMMSNNQIYYQVTMTDEQMKQYQKYLQNPNANTVNTQNFKEKETDPRDSFYCYVLTIGIVTLIFSIFLGLLATGMVTYTAIDIAVHPTVWYFGFVDLISFGLLLITSFVGCLSGGFYRFPRIRIWISLAFPIFLMISTLSILITTTALGSYRATLLTNTVERGSRITYSITAMGVNFFVNGLMFFISILQIVYVLKEISLKMKPKK